MAKAERLWPVCIRSPGPLYHVTYWKEFRNWSRSLVCVPRRHVAYNKLISTLGAANLKNNFIVRAFQPTTPSDTPIYLSFAGIPNDLGLCTSDAKYRGHPEQTLVRK